VAPNAAGLAAADFFSQGLDNPRVRQEINVNINGGLGTSAEIGEAVVNAIRQYNQVQGPANIAVV
jgi:succinyl-CoA synthetase beta subunit